MIKYNFFHDKKIYMCIVCKRIPFVLDLDKVFCQAIEALDSLAKENKDLENAYLTKRDRTKTQLEDKTTLSLENVSAELDKMEAVLDAVEQQLKRSSERMYYVKFLVALNTQKSCRGGVWQIGHSPDSSKVLERTHGQGIKVSDYFLLPSSPHNFTWWFMDTNWG